MNTDYKSRQVDVELLHTITVPADIVRVSIGAPPASIKIVTGVQKTAQRYVSLLLRTLGEVYFAPREGGTLLSLVLRGQVSNLGYLAHLFAIANIAALQVMSQDDADPRFGAPPPDERIVSAELLTSTMDYATATIVLEILLTTEAGDSYKYVVPVETGK